MGIDADFITLPLFDTVFETDSATLPFDRGFGIKQQLILVERLLNFDMCQWQVLLCQGETPTTLSVDGIPCECKVRQD